ncbi:MAG TPA: tRNA lysidine(34) synthetase TilS [Rheinheimera sp.]|uniref:tRNA lysidine(34) synthetase TilS n=1 Tax=Rheinheimera sp. TaxID=1869214 RepID=UPI000ECCC505|nr:tRNA lysidine(34) synthetase TilS [Rheinheimera sp.]HCU66441.1 tRNA lysidine(34) synthetase TilS [Rheinheimera sp.]
MLLPATAQPMLDSITQKLSALGCHQVVLALSGGLDSMVLLYLLKQWQMQQAGRELKAVYVHHGLSPNASAWADFCAAQCALLQLPFLVENVSIQGRENLEAKARSARYQALQSYVSTSDTALCTAHHADDQLETLLLALKRGSGVAGLAGIATQQPFAAGWLLRPLLDFSRDELRALAEAAAVPFIQDESNQNPAFDRNFLRLHVLPALTSRFPAIAKTSSRSMQLLGEVQQANDYLLQPLLARLQQKQQLDLAGLQQHPLPVQQLLLRAFLQQFGVNPSSSVLAELIHNLVAAKADAKPLIRLGDIELRRYQQQLYLFTAADLAMMQLQQKHNAAVWLQPGQQLKLQDGRILCWQENIGAAQQSSACWPLPVGITEPLRLEFGGFSRKFKPAGASMHKPLKQWLQLWQVPPWQRGAVPLVIAGQQIVGVLGYASSCTAAEAKSWLLQAAAVKL